MYKRQAINKLTVDGNKDLQTEQLMGSLKDIGLSEGETFDQMSLDRVKQELTRAYQMCIRDSAWPMSRTP